MKNKITKTRKKYVRKKKLPSQIIKELEIQLDNQLNKQTTLTKTNTELEMLLNRNREYTQNLEAEIAMMREKNLNLIEAVNVISRAERLRIQGNLWNNNNLQAVAINDSANQKDTDNYFDANS